MVEHKEENQLLILFSKKKRNKMQVVTEPTTQGQRYKSHENFEAFGLNWLVCNKSSTWAAWYIKITIISLNIMICKSLQLECDLSTSKIYEKSNLCAPMTYARQSTSHHVTTIKINKNNSENMTKPDALRERTVPVDAIDKVMAK